MGTCFPRQHEEQLYQEHEGTAVVLRASTCFTLKTNLLQPEVSKLRRKGQVVRISEFASQMVTFRALHLYCCSRAGTSSTQVKNGAVLDNTLSTKLVGGSIELYLLSLTTAR